MAATVGTAAEVQEHYDRDPVRLSGDVVALFERHLQSDVDIATTGAGAREKFEAAAHSIRDVLSQRWLQTQRMYDQANPKRGARSNGMLRNTLATPL